MFSGKVTSVGEAINRGALAIGTNSARTWISNGIKRHQYNDVGKDGQVDIEPSKSRIHDMLILMYIYRFDLLLNYHTMRVVYFDKVFKHPVFVSGGNCQHIV